MRSGNCYLLSDLARRSFREAFCRFTVALFFAANVDFSHIDYACLQYFYVLPVTQTYNMFAHQFSQLWPSSLARLFRDYHLHFKSYNVNSPLFSGDTGAAFLQDVRLLDFWDEGGAPAAEVATSD